MTTTQKNGGAATVPAQGIPRVTPEQVEAVIRKEEYLLHGRTTLCFLTLDNGIVVEGVNHGSVDPRLFNAELGKEFAKKGAVLKIWPLLGARLADELRAAEGKPVLRISPTLVDTFITRMEREYVELTDKIGKLTAFKSTELFRGLPLDERGDLIEQAQAMDDYAWVLRRRLRRAQAQKAEPAEQAA